MSALFDQESCNFNPFGGLDKKEIKDAIVPRISANSFLELLNSSDQIIIELVGKKGRGKTLHLKYLHQVLNDYPIYLLNNNSNADEVLSTESNIVFVDSIHHISLLDRLKLYSTRKKIILTTHISRKWEYKIARKHFKSIQFNGIDKATLKTIICNRINIASGKNESNIMIPESKLDELIKIHKDDFRGILNHLYEEFQLKTNDGRKL